MTRKALSGLITGGSSFFALLCLAASFHASSADRFDAAVAHAGRSAADLKRDAIDHPAEILRLTGIKPGMKVADVLAGDGYYSELSSYLVGPTGKVLLINNEAFDHWSDNLPARVAGDRLPNVEHETLRSQSHESAGFESRCHSSDQGVSRPILGGSRGTMAAGRCE